MAEDNMSREGQIAAGQNPDRGGAFKFGRRHFLKPLEKQPTPPSTPPPVKPEEVVDQASIDAFRDHLRAAQEARIVPEPVLIQSDAGPAPREAYLEPKVAQPKEPKMGRRTFLSFLGGGALVAAAAAVEAKTGALASLLGGGEHKVFAPGTSKGDGEPATTAPATEPPATTAPTEAPATAEPTQPPEVPTPIADPRESGLYSDIGEIPVPPEVQEKLKELTANYEVDLRTNSGIVCRQKGLESRTQVTEIGPREPKQINASSFEGLWFNTKEYPEAPEMYDNFNKATLDLIAERDGEAPVLIAYDGDSTEVRHIPVQDPSKVFFLDKYLVEAQEDGARQQWNKGDYMVGLSQGNSNTYRGHVMNDGWIILENLIFAADSIGDTLVDNDKYQAAYDLTGSRANMALPGLKPVIWDGTAPYWVPIATSQTVGRKLVERLSLYTMPNMVEALATGKTITSIFGTNGTYSFNAPNGQPLIHPNYK